MKKTIIILILAAVALTPVVASISTGVGVSTVTCEMPDYLFAQLNTRFDLDMGAFANVYVGVSPISDDMNYMLGIDMGFKVLDAAIDIGIGAKYNMVYRTNPGMNAGGDPLPPVVHVVGPAIDFAWGCPEMTLYLDIAPSFVFFNGEFTPYGIPSFSLCFVWGF